MKEKILFLTTEMPYPLDGGGKIRTYNMIKGIYKDYDIDLVCFSEGNHSKDDLNKLQEICNSVSIIDKVYTNSKSKRTLLKNIAISFLKNKPFIIEKFNDKKYQEILLGLLSKSKYKCIILDHLQTANYLKKLQGNKVILSQHNCEYVILKRRYEKENNILKKIYIWSEYRKTQRYEKGVCKEVNNVIMLSKEDKNFVTDDRYDGRNITIIPISIETNYEKKKLNNKVENILFLGTMSWFPNEQGILWFIKNVWNDIKESIPNAKLYVVGSNPSKEILAYSSPNIIVTGYVNSVDEYIEKCDVCVVPLFIGGGMRVKILECMAKGIPCVSTTIGAEGIEYTNNYDIMIADTSKEFVSSLQMLSDSKKVSMIVENSKNLIENKYSLKVLAEKLKEIIDN